MSLNLNAYAERFVRTIKEGCLERMILFGEDSLRNAIREFVAHYHFERNHQKLDNRLIISSNATPSKTGLVEMRRRWNAELLLLPGGGMNRVFGTLRDGFSVRFSGTEIFYRVRPRRYKVTKKEIAVRRRSSTGSL
jgi:hypothetical protein